MAQESAFITSCSDDSNEDPSVQITSLHEPWSSFWSDIVRVGGVWGNIPQNQEVYTLWVSSSSREVGERKAADLKVRIPWGTIVFFLRFPLKETELLQGTGPSFINQIVWIPIAFCLHFPSVFLSPLAKSCINVSARLQLGYKVLQAGSSLVQVCATESRSSDPLLPTPIWDHILFKETL